MDDVKLFTEAERPSMASFNSRIVQMNGALLNKANVTEETIAELSSPTQLMHGGRFNIQSISAEINAHASANASLTDYATGDFHALLLATHFDAQGCRFGTLLLTTPRSSGRTWVGQIWEHEFRNWIRLATATPPEWHNAPLETGWSWTTQGKYGKDGSGKVYLVGAVNKASAPLSGEAILRLPTGFRPPVLWPVSFSSVKGTDGSSWATYGYLWPDGYLRFSGGALPANYSLNQGIAFAAEFPAV